MKLFILEDYRRVCIESEFQEQGIAIKPAHQGSIIISVSERDGETAYRFRPDSTIDAETLRRILRALLKRHQS
jgi:hypothetical protein